jgi:hypothetical protein
MLTSQNILTDLRLYDIWRLNQDVGSIDTDSIEAGRAVNSSPTQKRFRSSD